MSDAKIQITVGAISFSGEGSESWLEKQLDKMLAAAPKLASIKPAQSAGKKADDDEAASNGSAPPLPKYLSDKNATSSQNRKFLATAAWLHLKGADRFSTADVTKALADAKQKRIGNASEAMNQNVGKGFVEKDVKGCYVTEEGQAELRKA